MAVRPPRHAHQEKQIQRSSTKVPLYSRPYPNISITSSTQRSEAEWQDSEETDPDHPRETEIWSGWFHFIPEGPEFPHKGWRVGCGRPCKTSEAGDVEFLLTSGRNYKVRGCHAAFEFLREQEAFVLKAKHNNTIVTVNGTDVTTLPGGFSLVGLQEFWIMFGELKYKFEFADMSTEHARRNQKLLLDQCFQRLRWPAPHESILGTMTNIIRTAGIYTIHALAAFTGRTTVRKGTNRLTNEVVAVKTKLQTPENQPFLTDEANLYRRIKLELRNVRGADHVMQYVDVVFEHGPEYPGIQERFLVWTPFVHGTFADLLYHHWSHKLYTPDQLLEFYRQAIVGIEALHGTGWVHRDIKPENIGYSQVSPPHVVILDLESAIKLNDVPGMRIVAMPNVVGTVGYHAPEMEQIGRFYDQPVDMWAIGCVGVELFSNNMSWRCGDANPWGLPTASQTPAYQEAAKLRFSRQLQSFLQAPEGSLFRLFACLLAHVDAPRLKAHEALRAVERIQQSRGQLILREPGQRRLGQ
ncbi:kinase-like protein [Myriangium duriaei CBS 260.36]|uniref:Kinase-like protein n=1 Tax=Myriangium duriaei CBS 260.36 TaxID=1168546 RepID=A0A9P4J5E5_9PEZI|nr:kinase-like protein [Myriangium duriaei CBS 260.36]